MTVIHILQASGRLEGHNATRMGQDYRIALQRNPDVAGFTELWGSARRELSDAARRAGYHLYSPGIDVAIAVRNGTILAQEHVRVSGGRSLVWVRWRMPQGDVVTFFETHWHTTHVHTQGFMSQTDDLITHMKAAAHGSHVVFYGGDANRNFQHANPIRDALDKNHMPTIYESLHSWEPTHGKGGTIDIIGSYTPDRRVTAHSVRVWPKTYSDHRQVSAWYDIAGTIAHGLAHHTADKTGQSALHADAPSLAQLQAQADAAKTQEQQIDKTNVQQGNAIEKLAKRLKGKRRP